MCPHSKSYPQMMSTFRWLPRLPFLPLVDESYSAPFFDLVRLVAGRLMWCSGIQLSS